MTTIINYGPVCAGDDNVQDFRWFDNAIKIPK